jgi:nanoRNase/pAp phosphatase (c-di-AMP/oligoRNAs hydrolase)
VDSQPGHHELFKDRPFDIIMDHHPVVPSSRADFVDIREKYGAMSTLMTEYLRAARIRPSTRLATALFYGIKTDTDNFVRESLPNDINAFRYLYKYANMNIIKKIESSEMTQKTLAGYQLAMERLSLLKGTAFVYMGEVGNPDVLVMIADFFMRMAEVTWSIAAGTYNKKVIVIVRNAGLHGDAGKIAKRWFEHWGASAGGHRSAARAEIGVEQIPSDLKGGSRVERLILKALREGP